MQEEREERRPEATIQDSACLTNRSTSQQHLKIRRFATRFSSGKGRIGGHQEQRGAAQREKDGGREGSLVSLQDSKRMDLQVTAAA